MYTMDRSQSLDEEYKKSLQKIILGMQGCLQVHNPEFVFKIPCSPTNQDIRCEEVQQSTSEKRKAENECDCLENASQKRLKLTESKTAISKQFDSGKVNVENKDTKGMQSENL